MLKLLSIGLCDICRGKKTKLITLPNGMTAIPINQRRYDHFVNYIGKQVANLKSHLRTLLAAKAKVWVSSQAMLNRALDIAECKGHYILFHGGKSTPNPTRLCTTNSDTRFVQEYLFVYKCKYSCKVSATVLIGIWIGKTMQGKILKALK